MSAEVPRRPPGMLGSMTAQVNVGGLIASTLDISNQNFLNGQYLFGNVDETVREFSQIINKGTIAASEGGFAVLAASAVTNEGTITAPLGTVSLASGDVVTVGISGDGAVSIAVDEAVSQGAKNLIPDPTKDLADVYLTPSILVDVTHEMRLMTEESFGPVVGVMKVQDDQEAIKLMNDSEYGLTASIWTQDENAAITIGEQVEAGTWFMNRCDYLDPALVWTGVKNSGRGCALSVLGYQQFVQPKSYHLRRI